MCFMLLVLRLALAQGLETVIPSLAMAGENSEALLTFREFQGKWEFTLYDRDWPKFSRKCFLEVDDEKKVTWTWELALNGKPDDKPGSKKLKYEIVGDTLRMSFKHAGVYTFKKVGDTLEMRAEEKPSVYGKGKRVR